MRNATLKILVVIGLILVAAALARVGSPATERMAKINSLITERRLGHVKPALQEVLDARFRWLAHHAGVGIEVAVNQPLRKDRLTLVVTDPEYESLTRCGPGNAILDPAMGAIFIDKELVHPYQLNIIGSPSVYTMFSPEVLPHVGHYTNFILGHELGHWIAKDRASAFFYYGFNEGKGKLSQELEADRVAIEILRRGYANGGRHPGASPAPNHGSLSDDQRLIDEVLGGIVQMNEDLLFSNGPYSPYFSDAAHPDFLSRVLAAVEQIGADGAASSRAAFLRAYAKRLSQLGQWSHREFFLPGPIHSADVRGGMLWIALVDIPPEAEGPGKSDPIEEKLYRIAPELLDITASPATDPFRHLDPVVTGFSREGEEFHYEEGVGAWADRQFEQGNPAADLPPPPIRTDPQVSTIWGTSKWGGLQKLGNGWDWPARGRVAAGGVTEADLTAALAGSFPSGTIQLGRLQWTGDRVSVPFVHREHDVESLHIWALNSTGPLAFDRSGDPAFQRNSGRLDVGGATFWRDAWWIPVRSWVENAGYRIEIWTVKGQSSISFGATDVLPVTRGEAGSDRFLAEIAPENIHFMPISGDRAILGYEGDAFYLLEEHPGNAHALKLLFAPAREGVDILDLGSDRLAIWKRNSRKMYVVESVDRKEVSPEPRWLVWLRSLLD